MTTSKRSGSNNNPVPVKISERYKINGKTIPVYSFPAGTIINPDEYILYNAQKPVKGRSAVLRKKDVLPKHQSRAVQFFSGYHFGRTLIDTFSPGYGFIYKSDNPRFYFDHSKVLFTSAGGWGLAIDAQTANDFEEQSLGVTVYCSGIPNPHLKIRLGQTADSATHRSILTVSSGLNNFKLNVAPINNHSLWLSKICNLYRGSKNTAVYFGFSTHYKDFNNYKASQIYIKLVLCKSCANEKGFQT